MEDMTNNVKVLAIISMVMIGNGKRNNDSEVCQKVVKILKCNVRIMQILFPEILNLENILVQS